MILLITNVARRCRKASVWQAFMANNASDPCAGQGVPPNSQGSACQVRRNREPGVVSSVWERRVRCSAVCVGMESHVLWQVRACDPYAGHVMVLGTRFICTTTL
jgi:hypothetical protein